LKELLIRTLTGIFIVVFILGGFWFHPVSFFITGLIILTGSQFEYYRIVRRPGMEPLVISGMASGILIYCIATAIAADILPAKRFAIITAIIPLIIISELFRKQEMPFDSLAHTLFPLFYIVLPLSLLPFSAFSHSGISTLLKHNIDFSPGMVVGFTLLLWTNDTMAYLAGVSLGRHKLLERISPNKTWEGFVSGLLFTIAIAYFFPNWPGILNRWQWIVVAIIISVTGTFGDLTESMLKRSLGIKDSGKVMPGHGGFLDRFDSVLISFPFVYLFIYLFG